MRTAAPTTKGGMTDPMLTDARKLTRWTADDRKNVVGRLQREGLDRDRRVDAQPRSITITDDEAVMLLDLLKEIP